MWKFKSTLTNRVTASISLLAMSLFFVLSILAFLVTFIIEDTVIHNVLRQMSSTEIPASAGVSRVTEQDLISMGYKVKEVNSLSERINAFGEFEAKGEKYHFMVLEDHILLLNTTDIIAVTARAQGILKLLLLVLIPSMILTLFVSRHIARRALRPFTQLKTQFLLTDKSAINIQQLNEKIRETDVKQIADELAQALTEKEQVLQQQISFNQGISHELRTPVQVMTHAVELLAIKHPELTEKNVYQRLNSALRRVQRTSEAMLWLTTYKKVAAPLQLNTSLAIVKEEAIAMYQAHGLSFSIKESDRISAFIPKEVFEFIVFNLVNNVIHHGREENGVKAMEVEVTQNAILVKNSIDVDAPNLTEKESSDSSFGLGLLLVEKFCQRFDLKMVVNNTRCEFIVKIVV